MDDSQRDAKLKIVPAADLAARSAVPPHLARTTWIKHESVSAKSALLELETDIRKLTKKVSENRVHGSRVSLRRWFSVWHVLRQDGWETANCKKRIIRPLKKLQSLLGELRDIDVNIDYGKKLGCTPELLDRWNKQRNDTQRKLERFIEEHYLKFLVKELDRFLRKRPKRLASKLPTAKVCQSAFDHIEFYLLRQESVVRELAANARTMEELHEMRLAIKRWRYLLTEFFGVTNLELVRAQQLLGQMHDLDRLTPLLVHDETQDAAMQKLKERRKGLLQEIEEMRGQLPYGLRPQISSTKAAFAAGFGAIGT